MALLVGEELGAERIQREALVLIMANIATTLAAEDAKWTALDQQLAQLQGVDFVQCISNIPAQPNFYCGHHPSLIESPITNYPNVSVITGQVIPSADQGDQYEGLSVALGIEAMVIDGPYTQTEPGFTRAGEDMVNRKCKRMAEALHSIMINNKTLNGVVAEMNSTPRVLFSDVQMRRENTSFGQDYYWQMVRLDYQVLKIAI